MEPIIMPQIGQDLETGIITEWKKTIGEKVEEGEIIACVESDKATFEIEADCTGILLEILVDTGNEGRVLEPIGFIGEEGEKLQEPSINKDETPEVIDKNPEDYKSEKIDLVQDDVLQKKREKIYASPVARKVAKERNIDLLTVKGTGPNGRIVKIDVISATEGLKSSEVVRGKSNNSVKEISKLTTIGSLSDDEVIKFSRIQQVTADRLTESKTSIPHFYLFHEIDVEDAMVWRELYNNINKKHVTITDMITHTIAQVLKDFPKMNSHISGNSLIIKKAKNIGLAVSTDNGLMVPVVANAERMDVSAISEETMRIAEQAKMGKIDPGVKSSFTISSMGMYGISGFLPIINPPEAAILGVGAVKSVPIVENGMIGVHRVIKLTLSCDHRAINGTDAAMFMNRIEEFIRKRFVPAQ